MRLGRTGQGKCGGSAYLVHALTGGDAHATDVSNASRTLLFDLQAMSWSDDLLARFRVPRSVLPGQL